ncbi:diacylglycerol/lipid kinase family protein [Halorientalis pallida]|uniref:YegS/Rv2252/BmrU family lipid kinase n=1 Tax=Halorientalis pallida TaxID=2479928 RepID=A0A498L188_9EURY|nr:YegS/Rv2252/BmrU family lipid kinase [Halorientalis pallida]RXK51837.1 YegS/Rv2252/BmrU family lipid kinase [Halorientalis pallida]
MTSPQRHSKQSVTVGDATGANERVLVLNPVSGDGDHADRVRGLAAEHDFVVRETESEGDAMAFAAEAATEGATLVAAAGGDGTCNEVVRGLVDAGALPAVEFAVVPAGTGNNFATNLGVEDVEHAFDVIETGERRRVDLGFANDEPFLNSSICGLTAEASTDTDDARKSELGVVAYALETVRTAVSYEGVELDVAAFGGVDGDRTWEGSAVLLLVGNGRRFPVRGRTQADVEDGALDVTVVEERPGSDLAGLARTALLERILGPDTDLTTRLQAPALTVRVVGDETATFSLDGEMHRASRVRFRTEPAAVRLPVGPAYEPTPDTD